MNARDFAFISIAFRTLEQRQRSDFRPLSRLNTLPACSPVNASRAALRLPAHDSGPGWLATPYLYDSFIRDFPPVYPGALQLRPNGSLQLLHRRSLRRRHYVGIDLRGCAQSCMPELGLCSLERFAEIAEQRRVRVAEAMP